MIKINNKEFKVIDAHLHLPWQDEYKTINEKHEHLKTQMKANKIDYGILISDSLLESSIGNNQQCLDVVESNPKLYFVYGFSPLKRYDEQLIEVEGLLIQNKAIGIKLYPGHDDFSMNDIRLIKVFDMCIKYDVPVVIHTEWNDDYYPQYSHPFYIKQIAEKFQNLRIVCCHIWMGRVSESLKLTEKLANVYYDISSFAISDEYRKLYPNVGFPTMEESVQLLEDVIKRIPDKVMFGSDFGSLKISDHIKMVLKSNLSQQELSSLLYDTAKRVYKI